MRWFTFMLVPIFAVAVMACGPADAPLPEATPAPGATPAEAAPTPGFEPAFPDPAGPLPGLDPAEPDPAAGNGAQPGDTVRVHYTGRLENGMVFDSSEGRDPLEFTLGRGQVIPGFEQGVLGMEPGQSATLNIPAQDAYGLHRSELVIEVPRAELPPDLDRDLEVGMRVLGGEPGAQPTELTVVDLTDTTVTLDANHPLAGEDLIFDIELVDVD